MSRNFGIPNTTSRRIVGGLDQSGGSLRADTQRDSISLSINPFEIGSAFLFALVVLFPIALVGGACLGYAAYAPEPVEYQASFKAN